MSQTPKLPVLSRSRHLSSRAALALGVLVFAAALAQALAAAPPAADRATATDSTSLREAINDLIATFGADYPRGPEYLRRLDQWEAEFRVLPRNAKQQKRHELKAKLTKLKREALLDNPLLRFDRMLIVKRPASSPSLGLPRNWQSNSSLPKKGYRDELVALSNWRDDPKLTRVYKPSADRFIGDVDLHFDADRLLFSMRDGKAQDGGGRWQVFEMRVDGSGLRQLTGEEPDVDSYDACYLPSGKIIFTSTACFAGVPCVYGSSHVANLYVMDADGHNIRQLCFDQEHDWCPTVMNDGRVLYTRWEYTDTPHSNTRLLFTMNPDGTEQKAYYGSNSYWPNSFFYTRPIPGHPTQVISVIGGHHDHPRMGELVLFDPALSQQESSGAIQRIGEAGKRVETIIRDGLTQHSWPKFLHPFPLSEKYFLVSCKPTRESLWGVYLVDLFDNFVLLKEEPGYALFEPIPVQARKRPPVIGEKVDLSKQDATVYISDIYAGPGLRGIPRGTVKSLRVFSYHYAYQNMGGLLGVVGMDGPWDVKRIIGTVPVYEDGSAKFKLPANTPVSIQPLDAEGKALQLMRSWMTAMPGEVVSCTGCHASPNEAPRLGTTIAQTEPATSIRPWYGPTRGFSFAREVQPVLDRYCIRCHDGKPRDGGEALSDLRGTKMIEDWRSITPGNGGRHAGKFSVSYAELHRYVRRPGIESDYHLLEPMEFHADTTELVQLLSKGHHGVQLDAEAWDRLITWIDLNCPYHGTWGEEIDKPGPQRARRQELLKKYAGIDVDPEAVPETPEYPRTRQPVRPATPSKRATVEVSGWPFSATEAKRRQASSDAQVRRTIDLGNGISLTLVRIPAGEFVIGAAAGSDRDAPPKRVRINEPFWMAQYEVTNEQYRAFDPTHDSRIESKNAYQFGIHGYPLNRPEQPVVRISWNDATKFCQWLSRKTGLEFSLPSEEQWEYACRAGAATPFFFGSPDDDFAHYANMADAKLTEFVSDPYTVDRVLKNPPKYDDWIPKDPRFNDGAVLTVAPGQYQPNAWGLFDMHGNVAEWTRSNYDTSAAQVEIGKSTKKVVRGGSWRDRPYRCTSSYRIGYQPYQRVFNVGFRVIFTVKQEQ